MNTNDQPIPAEAPSVTGGASEAPVSEEAKRFGDSIYDAPRFYTRLELQRMAQRFDDSETAELRRELAMANDAADKGEKGRQLGEAYDSVVAENASLRKQLDEQIAQTADACTGRDLARQENVKLHAKIDRLNEAYAQAWSECDTALESAGIVMDEDPHKLVVQGIAELRARLESAEGARVNLHTKLIELLHEHGTGETEECDGENINQMVARIVLQRDALQSTVDALTREIERITKQIDRASRKHLVDSAAYWHNSAMELRARSENWQSVFAMENAYNHVENALAASRDDLAETRRELEEVKAERDNLLFENITIRGHRRELEQSCEYLRGEVNTTRAQLAQAEADTGLMRNLLVQSRDSFVKLGFNVEPIEMVLKHHHSGEVIVQKLDALKAGLREFRDGVLSGRHQLESVLDNDQTNAVLALFDDIFTVL